jgi:TonB family protein
VRAQDSLSAAKELYASAAYDEALSALDRLKAGGPAAATVELDQYRAFCLFALGRTGEAEVVAESVVRADPLVDLHAGDTSPRIVALFTDLQKRLLPGLVRERYRTARASMDAASPDATRAELMLLQRLLAKAKTVGAWDEALGDLSVLVDGFLELNRSTAERRAAATPVEPGAAAPGPPPPTPVADGVRDAAPASSAAAAPVGVAPPSEAVPAPSATAAPARAAIYSALDVNVSAPVVLQQQIPRVPANLALAMRAAKRTGILEVTIDERGRVETALVRESVNPVFDGMVLAAARTWQYQPAKLEGAPVRYLKRIAIALQ